MGADLLPQRTTDPFLPTVISSSASLEFSTEAKAWNPYHVAQALIDESRRLKAEAEAAIYLDEDKGGEVLQAWAAGEVAMHQFNLAVAGEDKRLLEPGRQDVLVAVGVLRDAAHRHLKGLRR